MVPFLEICSPLLSSLIILSAFPHLVLCMSWCASQLPVHPHTHLCPHPQCSLPQKPDTTNYISQVHVPTGFQVRPVSGRHGQKLERQGKRRIQKISPPPLCFEEGPHWQSCASWPQLPPGSPSSWIRHSISSFCLASLGVAMISLANFLLISGLPGYSPYFQLFQLHSKYSPTANSLA